MTGGGRRHSIDLLFVLLIFAGFLVTALLLITLGTNEYQSVVESMQQNDDTRTAAAYFTQKIRQNKALEAVSAGTIEGEPALLIREEHGGRPYVTYLYVLDGELRELTTTPDNPDITLRSGTPILPMESLAIEELGDGLLKITMRTSNKMAAVTDAGAVPDVSAVTDARSVTDAGAVTNARAFNEVASVILINTTPD